MAPLALVVAGVVAVVWVASAVAAPPANTAPPTISGQAVVGQTLTASTGTWSNSPTGYGYQWQQCDSGGANCSAISGATGSTYTVAARGDTLDVVVTATNGDGFASASSSATAVVTAVPVNSAAPTITGEAQVGQTLTASTGTWSNSPTAYGYQWQQCDSAGASCAPITGATATSYVVAAGDEGHTLEVLVTASNADGSTSASSAATAVVVAAPANTTAPTVSGLAHVGQTLTASTGTWSGTAPLSYVYQWQRCDSSGANCVPVNGATTSSYGLSVGDLGTTMQVVVTASNSGGQASTASAVTTMVAAAVAPSNTSPPSISGTTAAGETLTADPGVWSGDPQITYTYQWQRCSAGSCAAISGATAQTYETISNDAGSTLEVSVTGSNPGGSQTLTSTATAAITAVSAPVATVAPSISGQAVQGGTLTANTGSWTGSGLSYAYQWETCGDYRSTVITDAPAGYWRLGESSGSAIADSSGNNLAGSLTGGVTLGQPGVVAGDGDTAISFDGSSGYASIADAPSLSFTGGSFTVEAWVKTTSAAMVPLVSKSSGSSTREYSLRLAAGGTPVFAVYSGGQTESAVSGPTAINDGHWHQVVGVASTSSGTTTLTVYVDGAPAGLTSTSGLTFTDTTAPLEIGRFNSPPDTTAYAAATIDEAAVYPTALSATRVQAHYAAAACSPISGATDSSYSVTASDAGFVRVAVTAANSVGSSTATSAGVGPIQGATPPVNVTPPWFTGNPVAGQTLDGFPGDWLGSAPINYGYQWQRCTTYEGTVQADAPTDWWKLQETTGSSAADSGAGGITAPYMSSPTLGAAGAVSSCGSSNTGVSFDGASQYVQLPQTVQFDSGNFSVEGWFKASTITDTNGAALWSSGYDGIAGSYVLVELSQNSGHPVGTLDFVASDAANDYVHVWSPSTYLDGRWHYFAATRNGSNFTLYVDGAPVGSASAAVGDVDSTGTYPEIGAFERGTGLNTSDPRHFNGSLDEIAVYKTALSASQVNAHFNAASQTFQDIAAATNSSYTVTSADSGPGVNLRLKVTATNASGSRDAYSLQAATSAASPANVAAPTVQGQAQEGQPLAATAGGWTGQAPMSYAYQWQRCSTGYAAAIAASAPAGYWTLDEAGGTSFADSSGNAHPATFASADVSLSQPGALAGDPDTAAYFHANGAGAQVAVPNAVGTYTTVEFWMKWDGTSGGSPFGFNAYGLYLDSQHFGFITAQGSLSGDYWTSSSNLPVNKWFLVDALFYSGAVTNDALYINGSSVPLSVDGFPDNSSPTSSFDIGALLEGNNHLYGYGGALDDVAVYPRALSTSEIQAHYNTGLTGPACTDIQGAPGSMTSSYAPTASDVGSKLRVKVTATNASGSASAVSNQSDPALPEGAPVIASAPAVTGTGLVGDTLTSSPGAWSGSPTSFAYQWQRCSSSCSDIAGATGTAYTTVAGDSGYRLQLKVTATNVLGTSSPASSNSIPVSSTAPYSVTPPSTSGNPASGGTLTAANGTWSGAQSGMTYTYQWQRCSSGYASAVASSTPAGYWRLGDGGGTSLADSSGNGHAASFAIGDVSLNQPGALSGDANTAAGFNGGGGARMTVPGAVGTYTTVEFWMKWNGSSGGFPFSFDTYGLGFVDGGFGFDTAQGSISGSYTTSTGNLPVNQWFLVDAFFYNGAVTNDALYINGTSVGLAVSGFPGYPSGNSYASSTMDIGAFFEGSTPMYGYTGGLDEIAVYPRGLSAAEIQAHYNAAAAAATCSNIAGATAQTYQPVSADVGDQIRLQVTATNSYGSASAFSSMTMPVGVDAPVPAAPVDSAGVQTLTPTLSVQPLNPPGATSVSYQFQVGADPKFTQQLAGSQVQSGTSWAVPSSAKLKDGQAFWWRVQAQYTTSSGTVTTSWSPAQKVTVRIVTVGSRPYWPMWTRGPFAVNEATGNLVLSVNGPSFPTPSGSMGLGLTYNSQDTRNMGLGPGWTLSGGDFTGNPPTQLVDHSLFPSSDSRFYYAAEVVWPDGSSSFYTQVGSGDTYMSPPGDTSQLKKNSDGSWTLIDSDGSIYGFGKIAAGATSTPLASSTQADVSGGGLSYGYALSNGQSLLTAITDTANAGRAITLTWNALNASGCPSAIVCVTGPDGVTWKLAGSSSAPTAAPLASVNDGTLAVAALGYDASGQLTSYENADDLAPSDANTSPGYNGTHSIQVGYDGTTSAARVTSFAEGPVTGLAGVTACPSDLPICWSFAYHSGGTTDASQSHGGARDATGWTEITPPNQQGQASPAKAVVYYDSLDHPIETKDVLGRISEAAYNGNDELLWQEDTLGNPTDYTWDTVTDTLQSVLGPPNQDGVRPLTRYGYDETAIGSAGSGSASWTAGPALQGLQGAYYPNIYLAGQPALRNDASVDFNWGNNPPDPIPSADLFSVRWTGYFNAASAGDYTFTLNSNAADTSALVVDDVQAIDNTISPLASASSHPLQLSQGRHKLVIEYVAASRPAEFHFSFSCADCNPAQNARIVPAADLLPAWNNQTSVVSPLGRISFSHYADPGSGHSDYTLQTLADGTPLITSYRYDSFGRTTEQVGPLGNAARTIDAQGNLSGAIDDRYRTTYTYYAAGATPAIPLACTGGSTVQSALDQAQALQRVSPPGSAPTSYVYDRAGRQLAKTDGAGTTCASYTAEGRVASTTDGDGNTTRFSYDPAGNQRVVTQANATKTSKTYDEAGNLTSSTDAGGHTTRYAYDAEGNLARTTDPLNAETVYSYDAAGNRVTQTDPLGNTTRYAYDALNRLVSTTSPRGNVSKIAYDAAGHVTKRTDPLGNHTDYHYDADGEQDSVTGPTGAVTSYAYDQAGRQVTVTDPNRNVTSFVYDLNGDKTEIHAADTGVTKLAYDPAGNLVSSTDPDNHTTTYAYDQANRLIATTLPTGEVTKQSWDPAGNKISSTDAAGNTTKYGYDALNRPVSTTTPLGETTKLGYDAAGNLATRTNALGDRWSYSYDADNRQTTSKDPLGDTSRTVYDANSDVLAKVDPNGHKTSYLYDADGRLSTITAPDGGISSLAYDAAGNILSRTDPRNHSTHWTYDADGRTLTRTDPLGDTWTYSYDAAGNLKNTVDANGNATVAAGDGTTSYSYDKANRLTGITYSDAATPAVGFAYDLAGNRISMTDGAGSATYGYDNSNRLTSVNRGGQIFSYSYSNGLLASRAYPNQQTTSYTYNADGQLHTSATGTNTTTYGYNANGALTSTAFPNGWTQQRTYDTAGRLSSIQSVNGAQTLAAASYSYDPAGNPTQVVRDGSVENYQYDSSNRVTAVCYGAAITSCPAGSLITYSYDRNGNRLSQNAYGTSTSYSYNAADQLTQAAVSGGATISYSYDANGNELSAGSRTFTYDLAGRVTQIQDGATTLASFSYDGNGNRLTKTTSAGTTSYLWDQNASLPTLAEEMNGSAVLRAYQYGADTGSGLDPISMSSGGGSYYLHQDLTGSTVAVTNQAGAVEWQYTYDPYGQARTTTKVDPNAPANVSQYAGQLQDPETGLYDMRARLYDPTTGRFLSTDPMPLPPTEPAVSLYLYAADDPLLYGDPSGNEPIALWLSNQINQGKIKKTKVIKQYLDDSGLNPNVPVSSPVNAQPPRTQPGQPAVTQPTGSDSNPGSSSPASAGGRDAPEPATPKAPQPKPIPKSTHGKGCGFLGECIQVTAPAKGGTGCGGGGVNSCVLDLSTGLTILIHTPGPSVPTVSPCGGFGGMVSFCAPIAGGTATTDGNCPSFAGLFNSCANGQGGRVQLDWSSEDLAKKIAGLIGAGCLFCGNNPLAGPQVNDFTKQLQDLIEQVQDDRKQPPKNRAQRRADGE